MGGERAGPASPGGGRVAVRRCQRFREGPLPWRRRGGRVRSGEAGRGGPSAEGSGEGPGRVPGAPGGVRAGLPRPYPAPRAPREGPASGVRPGRSALRGRDLILRSFASPRMTEGSKE